MTVTKDQVLQILNDIVDPCSSTAGVPTGLVDMGMVESVDVTDQPDGTHIAVDLLMTEFGCLMAVPFRVTATDLLETLPGVAHVEIGLCTTTEWTEDRMSPETRLQLAERRSSRRRELGIPEVPRVGPLVS